MAEANRSLFRKSDMWLPILPFSGMALLCFIVAFMATGQPIGAIISALTGVLMLIMIALFYVARYVFTKHDYVTKHGVYVVLGKKNKPTKEEVEEWSEYVIDFWENCHLKRLDNGEELDRDDILEAINNLRCFFYDSTVIGSIWRTIRGVKSEFRFVGLSIEAEMFVGYVEDNKDFTKRVYIHELSHPLLGMNSFPSGAEKGMNFGDTHHNMYKEYGLKD